MAFQDIRMPQRICEQFSGGPTFATSLVRSRAGYVSANVDRPDPVFQYEASAFLKDTDMRISLMAFYMALKGMGYTFRFRDMAHYWTGCVAYPGSGAITALATCNIQVFATGDGVNAAFQLTVPYVFGSIVTLRKITKPCNWGSADTNGDNPGYTGPTFWVETGNGTNVFNVAAGWTLDTSTGILTLASIPANGARIKWAGLFDVHARWQDDAQVLALLESPESATMKLRITEELGA